jgi:hypothetical protein
MSDAKKKSTKKVTKKAETKESVVLLSSSDLRYAGLKTLDFELQTGAKLVLVDDKLCLDIATYSSARMKLRAFQRVILRETVEEETIVTKSDIPVEQGSLIPKEEDLKRLKQLDETLVAMQATKTRVRFEVR